MEQQIIKIDEATWRIEDSGVRFFVLAGTDKALLIDSGMKATNVKKTAEELTGLPVELINTHADMDHTGANSEFEEFYMHPSEAANYYNSKNPTGKILPVWDGDIIELGSRPIRVILTPGHTPGSIALLDINKRALISGDPIQDGGIFMFGPYRDLHAYNFSLEKLEKIKDEFDVIYPSHGSFPVMPELMGKLHDGVEKILAGEISSVEKEFHGNKISVYDIGCASIFGVSK